MEVQAPLKTAHPTHRRMAHPTHRKMEVITPLKMALLTHHKMAHRTHHRMVLPITMVLPAWHHRTAVFPGEVPMAAVAV